MAKHDEGPNTICVNCGSPLGENDEYVSQHYPDPEQNDRSWHNVCPDREDLQPGN